MNPNRITNEYRRTEVVSSYLQGNYEFINGFLYRYILTRHGWDWCNDKLRARDHMLQTYIHAGNTQAMNNQAIKTVAGLKVYQPVYKSMMPK